jgi:hypothetical protein
MICLDTNAVIAAINRRKPELRRRLESAIVATKEASCAFCPRAAEWADAP